MKNRYKRILRKDSNISETASELSDEFITPLRHVALAALNVIVPVLVMYVHWILSEAEKRNIKRLYFLARDSYLMYHIALILCKKLNLNIKCSYFYCSRYSLRMAAYRFFDDCAYEKLFIHSYKLSPYNMLKRAGFSKDERLAVYKETGIVPVNERAVMGKSEFDDFCKRVKETKRFEKIIKEKSDIAYKNTILYIKQEYFQNYDTVGIVDLGWTGSLQYTLKKLLESADIKTNITGFYIGMLDKPPVKKGSVYITWLFDEKKTFTKSWFSHNLLECICSAPHGMTMGYRNDQGYIRPITATAENNTEYISLIEEMSSAFSLKCDVVYQKIHRKIALRLLKKLMFHPTEDEVYAFRNYCFCDDMGEQYHNSIVQITDNRQYRKQILPYKIRSRDSTEGFYWYYGSAKVSNLLLKTYYKYMYLFTRYTILKLG